MATITLNLISSSTPTNGYIVKYRQVGTVPYTTLQPYPTTLPIIISPVGAGTSYEGTVQPWCGGTQYGTLATWSATVAARFNMSRDPSSSSNACSNTTYSFVFYAATATLSIGTQLYADSGLSIPYTTAGYYSDGTQVYNVTNAGVVTSADYCP